ncbi:MAG: acyl carrier protein [Nitrospinota bacterium]
MKERIRKYIFQNFLFDENEGTLGDDDSLLEKGIIDSTGVLELVMFLEEDFQIEVKDEDLVPENLDTVNNLVKYINSRQTA